MSVENVLSMDYEKHGVTVKLCLVCRPHAGMGISATERSFYGTYIVGYNWSLESMTPMQQQHETTWYGVSHGGAEGNVFEDGEPAAWQDCWPGYCGTFCVHWSALLCVYIKYGRYLFLDEVQKCVGGDWSREVIYNSFKCVLRMDCLI